jgi:uncharacterized protein YaiI (UPF0178 family)
MDEIHIESRTIALHEHFSKFGLTDLAIIEAVRKKFCVITDDSRLAAYMERSGVDVINFEHYRSRRD